MRQRFGFLVVSIALASGACSAAAPIDYRTAVRYPDDQGIVTAVSLEEMTIDGRSAYAISEDIQSFSTRDHQTTPIVDWKESYVHVGFDASGNLAWVAGIGIVVEDDEARVVLYRGVLSSTDDDGNSIFEDGTVFRFAQGIDGSVGQMATFTIDAQRDLIIEMELI